MEPPSPPGLVAEGRRHCCIHRWAPRAGRVDASLPPSAASADVKLRWVPVLAGGDHGRGALYLRYGLSYRDIEEPLAERGIKVDHVTVYRWVQRFTPLLVDAARPCRHAPGHRWSSMSCCLPRATSWSNMPTTPSKPIMVGSRPGSGQCGGSNGSARPE